MATYRELKDRGSILATALPTHGRSFARGRSGCATPAAPAHTSHVDREDCSRVLCGDRPTAFRQAELGVVRKARGEDHELKKLLPRSKTLKSQERDDVNTVD